MSFFHLLKRCEGVTVPEKSSPTLKELITIKMEEPCLVKSRLGVGAVVINTSSFLFRGFGLGIYLCIFKTKYYKMPQRARVGRSREKRGSSGEGVNGNVEPRRRGAGGERGREPTRWSGLKWEGIALHLLRFWEILMAAVQALALMNSSHTLTYRITSQIIRVI